MQPDFPTQSFLLSTIGSLVLPFCVCFFFSSSSLLSVWFMLEKICFDWPMTWPIVLPPNNNQQPTKLPKNVVCWLLFYYIIFFPPPLWPIYLLFWTHANHPLCPTLTHLYPSTKQQNKKRTTACNIKTMSTKKTTKFLKKKTKKFQNWRWGFFYLQPSSWVDFFFVCGPSILPSCTVARSRPRGTVEILWTGTQRAAGPHAAASRLDGPW